VYKILDDNILLYSFTDIHPLVSENMLHAQKQTQPRYKLRHSHKFYSRDYDMPATNCNRSQYW